MTLSLNSIVSESRVKLKCLWESNMARTIDMAVIYKILVALKETNGSAKMYEIQEKTGLGWGTLEKYLEYMKAKGLVDEEASGRARIIKITKKGEDFIFLFSRVLSLLAEI